LVAEKEAKSATLREAKSAGDGAGVRARSAEIADIEADRRAARAVLSILRTQGDALAWTVLDFQRSAATVLGEGERVDRLAAAEGLKAELAKIDEAWAGGVLAIHTDLTSCLRHGDLLSVVSWEPRRFGLTEVKASRKTDGDSPQVVRIQKAISLLNDGAHPSAADGGALEIVRSPVAYRSHVATVAPLIKRAREDSYVAAELEDGLAVEVYDERNPARLKREDFEARKAAFRSELGWEHSEEIVYSTAARRLRDRTHSFSSLAPVTLLPFAVEDTSALVTGRLDIITRLNATRLEQRLAELGLEESVARGKESYEGFLTAKRGSATLAVPAHVREQVSVELLTLSALMELIDWMLARLEAQVRGGPTMIVDFADEATYWTSYQDEPD
jgi:hypothetical protein